MVGKRRNHRKRRRRNKKHLHALGRLGNEIGKAGETRALNACKHTGMPKWWRGIRAATKKEDEMEEKDLVISTDVGDVYIQIKTSLMRGRLRQTRRTKEHDIPIVRICLNETDAEIRKKILHAASVERNFLLTSKK